MKSSILLLSACLVAVYNSCSAASIVKEIYNGQRAVKGQFPFDVLIHGSHNGGKGFYCGGSLISDTWVMTAGHCCYETNYTIISAGFVDRKDMADAQNFTSTKDNIHIHPQYDKKTITYDICVIKLPSAITTTKYVSVINLPPKSDAKPNIYENKIATASGWGKTKNSHHGANQFLMFKDVRVMSTAVCKRRFRHANDKTICTDKSTNGGPCPGDSGSPLIINGTDGNPEAIGLVSFGSHCESKDPVVYTQVASYLDWINEVTGIPVK